MEVPACAPEVTIWIPRAFEAQPRTVDLFIRKPDDRSADLVTLQVSALKTRLAGDPKAPQKDEILARIPTLEILKFEGSVGGWKGKPVALAAYEGRFRGQNISGRMAWLPLRPGTLILNVWGDSISERTISEDWTVILSGVFGPEPEVPLRERAPGRWWLAKMLGIAGLLAIYGTVIAMMGDLREAMGGLAFFSLAAPIITLVYALAKFHEFPRAVISFLVGIGLIGVMILLGG